MKLAIVSNLVTPLTWLLFIIISVICYGGYTYWVTVSSDPIDPSLIIATPMP